MKEIFILLLRVVFVVTIAVLFLTGLSLILTPTYNTTSYSSNSPTTKYVVRSSTPATSSLSNNFATPLNNQSTSTTKGRTTVASTTTRRVSDSLFHNKNPRPQPTNKPKIQLSNYATSSKQYSTTNKLLPIPPSYTTPPQSLEKIHTKTLPAIVNILCGNIPGSRTSGITGSGVIIDGRGIILTNAHVAQYVLLQQYTKNPTHCVVRVGAPAKSRYTVSVLAISDAWVRKYANEIKLESPTGTGENDWGLLYITGRTNKSNRELIYPFIPIDAREAVTKTGDKVLISSYPAGFLGGATIRRELWPLATIVTVKRVYTFSQYIIDVLSLGGNIVAQGGSSGGAIINQWGKLVGIIATSSTGDTTNKRDLRAITLSHINRSIENQSGASLDAFLQKGNFKARVKLFKKDTAPILLKEYKLQ